MRPLPLCGLAHLGIWLHNVLYKLQRHWINVFFDILTALIEYSYAGTNTF